MRRLAPALILLLAWAPARAKQKAGEAAVTASTETIKLVEAFTSMDTADLPVEAIPRFMTIDPKSLPARLRSKYQAKRIELTALKKNADAKKKGYFRRMGNDKQAQCAYEEGDETTVATLRDMGFEQITEDEEKFLMQKTNCSECELNEDFTLTMYIVPPKKKGERPVRYLFLSESDPIMALIAARRAGTTGGTNFFGAGGAGGCR